MFVLAVLFFIIIAEHDDADVEEKKRAEDAEDKIALP